MLLFLLFYHAWSIEEIAHGKTEDLIANEHLKAREMVVEVPHPQRGTFTNVGCPLQLSDFPVEVVRSPLLSEHAEEVLGEVMGYDKDTVEQLRQDGVI
jgi:formyl-CoA transferase